MKVPVENKTKMPIYVGSAMIPPGETRHFDEHEVPHHLRPVPVAEETTVEQDSPLADLLKGTVGTVVAALADMQAADIEQIEALEASGQNRKGVMGAIREELLNRAAQAEMLAKVEALADEELAVALEDAKTDINIDPDYLAALEAEAAKRNPESAE
jgi:hypothetical protein